MGTTTRDDIPQRWLLRFVPERYKQGDKPDQLVHAYVVVGMLLLTLALGVVALLLTYLDVYRSIESTLHAWVLAGVSIASYILGVVLFYRTGSFFLVGNFYALPTFVAILQWISITNGFDSPALPLLLTIPVIVFAMSGRLMGILWTLAVLCAIGGLYRLKLSGFPFLQIIANPEAERLWWLLHWALLGIVNAGSLWVYDLVNRALAARLESERNEFEFRAAHDALTRIANRATFEKWLREETGKNHSGTGGKTVVVLLDLDDFKPVNDRHGHQAGDEVLIVVANRIRNSVRATDLVARLGGDEFAVIMRGVDDSADLHKILDNLVKQIASPIRTREASVTVTCSVGAVVCPDHGLDYDTLANYADKLLYQAKDMKNRYVLAG